MAKFAAQEAVSVASAHGGAIFGGGEGSAAPGDAVRVTRLDLPGDAGTLEFHRDHTGTLRGIIGHPAGADRPVTYLTVDPDGTQHWGGVCQSRLYRTEDGLARDVVTPHQSWTEHYRWRGDLLVEIDGVEVRRDDEGRVIACLPGGLDPAPAEHRWFYAHHGPGPIHITTPRHTRLITTDADGRVRSYTEDGRRRELIWTPQGVRLPLSSSGDDHVDGVGRRWVTHTREGIVSEVFLWDGSRCLARIDGPVGEPLAAVFSLDPSATPVRVITPTGTTRIPRDAYGEGLLDHGGVPGLYGGHVHDGLVHLPLRRLDPRTGTWCEPDPLNGSDDDPRRTPSPRTQGDSGFHGALPVELEPRSPYEVCRSDPIGRADPTGGLSVGLLISTLTWSFQNNVLTFFGIDWWFNLFASLFTGTSFVPTDGLSSTRGAFALRRDGIINTITEGRAFATQHIIWSPDEAFAELQRGEVIEPARRFTPTHYGTVLSLDVQGRPPTLLASLPQAGRPWLGTTLTGWTRHGGIGQPAAPGTLTPVFPDGGIHLDQPLDTRHDQVCTLTELTPGVTAVGTLEPRSFLSAPGSTGLSDGDRVLVDDGTTLALADVIGIVPAGSTERVQLREDLVGLGTAGLSLLHVTTTPASTEPRNAGATPNSFDARGTAATYAAADIVRADAAGTGTVARVVGLQAQLPLERPLPATLTAPVEVALGVTGAGITVTMAGANLDFGPTARPGVGAVGVVVGGGQTVGVRIEAHAAGSEATVDVALPAAITGAASIRFHPVARGTVLGTADGPFAAAALDYRPLVPGAAPDGSAGTVVIRCSGGGQDHVRLVPGPPAFDVVTLDRAAAGPGPWTVERYPVAPGARVIAGLSRVDMMALHVPDPAPFAAAPGIFLTRVAGSPPTPAPPPSPAGWLPGPVDIAGGVITTTNLNVPIGLEPGRPVLVSDGTTSRVATVASLRLTLTLANPVTLSGGELSLVGLAGTGYEYAADVTGPGAVICRPQTNATPAIDLPFPRIMAGDLIRVEQAPTVSWHRVVTADGGRLTLTGGPALTVGPATVRQVATTAPTSPAPQSAPTGGPFLGINGRVTPVAPGVPPASISASFDVWWPTTPTGPLGIVDGPLTHPATLATPATGDPLVVTFTEPFDLPGATVSLLTHQASAHVTTLARDGGVLLVDGATSALLGTGPASSLVAVAQLAGTSPAVAGTLGPGTLLVPDSESTEIDRGQALTDHELEHTLQYAKWGPLWFNAFPMLAMELPGILATDTELPDYSPFVTATVEATDDGWVLTLPSGGTQIGAGDTLQVTRGAQRVNATVRRRDGNRATVTADGILPIGEVSVRKRQDAPWFDGFHAALDLLTHGGLLNLLAGTTWSSLFWLIGKGAYGLGRAIFGAGDLYPATAADDGMTLTLGDDAGRAAIRSSGRVTVRKGDDTVVRSMTREGDTVRLTAESAPFTGAVQVAMYDTHNPGDVFDWYDYHPGTVDVTNHSRITMASGGFAVDDLLVVKYRTHEFRTEVTAVNGPVIDLLDAVPVSDDEVSVRIAKHGARNPLGNADSAVMTQLGMGWMKWLFDPYGQIEYAAAPSQEWKRWLLRVMRWVLGTQNFSFALPGYLWWFRLWFHQEHLAPIEQEASSHSGDLYSPLGRLTGEQTPDGFARARMVVGDIARYRYWESDRNATIIAHETFEAPGVPVNPAPDGAPASSLRVLPNRATTGPATAPNGTTVAGPNPEAGRFVADVFTQRDPDPRTIPPAGPPDALGLRPSALGSIPTSPRRQRAMGTYVAFTRPGDHRVTVRNGIPSAGEAVETHDRELQALFYDVTVTDVEVRLAGRALAEGDAVTLIPFQRAAVAVTPNGVRAYRLAVTDPGTVLAVDAMTLRGVAPGTAEPVEVSRFHEAVGGRYAQGGLAFAGMHLSRSVHIPVRRFTATVANTLDLLAAPALGAAALPTLARGTEAFLLVPAPIVLPPRVTTINGAPPPGGFVTPVLRVAATDAATLIWLGTMGSTFRLFFPAGSPTGTYVINVDVGDTSGSAPLTCTFDLT